MDWIKVEAATPRKPEVLKIARLLNVTADDAFGKAMRFWLWLDGICVDGRVDGVTSTDVDAALSCTGLASALCSVGWCVESDAGETLIIPNWDRHNSESAKARALKARRQKKWRDARVDGRVDGAASTPASTREEKRRDKERNKERKNERPSLEDVMQYAREAELHCDGQAFFDHFTANGWVVGRARAPMKDWKAALRNWAKREPQFAGNGKREPEHHGVLTREELEARERSRY